MKVLRVVRMERCTGCHCCSLACSRLVYGSISWKRAGIAIRSCDGGFEAVHCQACHPAPCASACPGGALRQRPAGGVSFDPERCQQCGNCSQACPEGAVHFDPELGVPVLCVHCGRCVAFCPQGCLEMADVSTQGDTGHG